jgi:hypothetical protein
MSNEKQQGGRGFPSALLFLKKWIKKSAPEKGAQGRVAGNDSDGIMSRKEERQRYCMKQFPQIGFAVISV